VEERVARYGKGQKEATRRRIVESAGRRFKRDGIDASGIATLMSDAGLTNGAFYAHFASKDDLIATVVSDQLRAQAERRRALPPGGAGLEQFVREYLTVEHCESPQDGCPCAALLDEIGRAQPEAKHAFTDGLLAYIDDIAARLAPDDPQSERAHVLSVFAMMVGTVQLARALADQRLAREVLEQGIGKALAMFGVAHQS
jgi:TetR/AcrR family transcriptional repressor of nem operon